MFKIEKSCHCGKYKTCVNVVTIQGAGQASIDSNKLLDCGKIQKQLEQVRKIRGGGRVV